MPRGGEWSKRSKRRKRAAILLSVPSHLSDPVPHFRARFRALGVPTRAGDFALFAEIAGPMLEEKEFFVRKAIGWVLREVSKKRPALVRDFLLAHGSRASGVTWREATKYLPAAMKRAVESAREA